MTYQPQALWLCLANRNGQFRSTPEVVLDIVAKQPGLVEYCQTPRSRGE